ncbi:MAG: peptide chain release factor N(5)-glutamine methyltransferase [Candidatus Krumholzibacteriales bacterium]
MQGQSKNLPPPTVIEAVKLSERYLEKRQVESPRLSAERLLAKAIGCSRMDLYLNYDRVLEEDTLCGYRADLKKRGEHYPLQYILGETEFFSLPFRVSEEVFIPRPETEVLIERAEEIFNEARPVRFLEFGLGSGVISGTLAYRHPGWRGAGFDISGKAVSLSRDNFRTLGVLDRLETLVASGFEALSAGQKFDLLVSNPPYIPAGEIDGLQKEVSVYENRTALDGGPDGGMFYPVLAEGGIRHLVPEGVLLVETGDGMGEMVKEIFESYGYRRVKITRDYSGLERVVSAVRPEGTGC